MGAGSTSAYLFGDLLALARLSWVRQMASRLAQLGYPDYRRSDAAALRLLRRGPVPVGRLGAELGVTRQPRARWRRASSSGTTLVPNVMRTTPGC